MRITTPGQARANYYDRNPLAVRQGYSTIAAPAGSTLRLTYTVPANRKAWVNHLHHRFHRVTVAAPVGQTQLDVTDESGTVIQAQLFRVTNIVGDTDQVDLNPNTILLAAQGIQLRSTCTDTGGTADYTGGWSITEYDA